jgi:hypothetical protein
MSDQTGNIEGSIGGSIELREPLAYYLLEPHTLDELVRFQVTLEAQGFKNLAAVAARLATELRQGQVVVDIRRPGHPLPPPPRVYVTVPRPSPVRNLTRRDAWEARADRHPRPRPWRGR